MKVSIANIRKDYKLKTLLEADVSKNPFDQFELWWNEAISSEIDEINAMTLATCTKEGMPSARIVLLKDFSEAGFTFFTNYESQKGKELENNPVAALVFFWKELERQIRIVGKVQKVSREASEEYFISRPKASKIGAWSSAQSKIIKDRKVIEDNVIKYTQEFGEEIPHPPHWGGYLITPQQIEFWQGRHSRLHDRIQYTLKDGVWLIERLAP